MREFFRDGTLGRNVFFERVIAFRTAIFFFHLLGKSAPSYPEKDKRNPLSGWNALLDKMMGLTCYREISILRVPTRTAIECPEEPYEPHEVSAAFSFTWFFPPGRERDTDIRP